MDLTTGKIFICRHVRFDETVLPFAELSKQGRLRQIDTPAPWGTAPVLCPSVTVPVQSEQPLDQVRHF